MKQDGKDVNIFCFGQIRGCKVNHCSIAGSCMEFTKIREKAEGVIIYEND